MLKGTQTEKNILTAFCGESQARNRYTYFSSQAKKEGFVQISQIFAETADHEREHAKRLFKLLEGGEVDITASFPAGMIGSTQDNLKEAAHGERYEYSTMYPEFAETARNEGFPQVADIFTSIAVAEQYHEERYLKLLDNIEHQRVFQREEVMVWRCQNCGFLHEGTNAPDICPACNHPQAHFELKPENY